MRAHIGIRNESQHKLVIYYNKPRISPLKKCLTMNKQLPPLIIKIDIEQKASLERKLIMVNLSTSIELKILQLLNKIKRKWGKKKYNSFKQYSNK